MVTNYAVLQEKEASAAKLATDLAAVDVTFTGAETATTVKNNVTLVPGALAQSSTIGWTSTGAVSPTGVVTRAIHSVGDAAGTLTATLTNGGITDTKDFALTVLKKDFAVAGQALVDNTFTITPDGYALTDFNVALIEIAANTPTHTVNGIVYTVSYDNATGIATVTPTSGVATATAVGASENITITLDDKVERLQLYISAVTAADDFSTVIVTVE